MSVTKLRQFKKATDESRPFTFDWSDVIDDVDDGSPDTIDTSVFTVSDPALTVENDAISGSNTIAEISGGAEGQRYRLKNVITLLNTGYQFSAWIVITVDSDPF